MQFTLNIGLVPSKLISRTEQITRAEVLAALRGAGFTVSAYREDVSNTEATAVVRVEAEKSHDHYTAFFNVSSALYQDCIAVQNEKGNGSLIGPNAEAWGLFNADYFIPYRQTVPQGFKVGTAVKQAA